MKTNKYFILNLLIVILNLANGGNVIPIGGYIYSYGHGNWTHLSDFKAYIVYSKDSDVPDSVYFFDAGRNSRYITLSNYTLLCDSTILAEYDWTSSIQGGPTIRISIDSLHSLSVNKGNLYYFYLYQYPPLVWWSVVSPKYFCGTIYNNPKEVLRGNLFTSIEDNSDTIRFDQYGASIFTLNEDYSVDSSINLNYSTGDFIFYSNKMVDTHLTSVDGRFTNYPGQTRVATCIVTDSSLHGRFCFDEHLVNQEGFIEASINIGDTLKFEFTYIDSNAISVSVEEYSTLTRFGGTNPVLSFNSSADSFNVSFKVVMDSLKCKHLPGSYIFHLMVNLKDGRCITRMISFIASKNKYSTNHDLPVEKERSNLVFPNPATEIIHTLIKGEYIIFDTIGRMVKKGICNDGDIFIGDLETGCYSISIVPFKNTMVNNKFIKI